MPSLVEIGSVVPEKMKCKQFTDRQIDGRWTTSDQKSSLELSAQMS